MPYAVLLNLPGISSGAYDRLSSLLGLENALPEGCLSHAAGPADESWRAMQVWESRDAFATFSRRLDEALAALGIERVEPVGWAVEHHRQSAVDDEERALSAKVPSEPPAFLTTGLIDALVRAGQRSLPSRDVPAAAAVVYKDTVVMGWNDVAAANNPAGHADINAIGNAMAHFGGAEKFKRLDRGRLSLVTTYEPCPMCEGLLAGEHGIRPENMYVLMLKEREHRHDERARCRHFRHGWRYVARDDVQQRLFCMHPGYRAAFPERCREQ